MSDAPAEPQQEDDIDVGFPRPSASISLPRREKALTDEVLLRLVAVFHAGVPRLRELRSAIETALRPTPAADAELRRLSEAATQGPWRTGVPTSYCIVDEQAREMASTEYLIDDGGTAEEAQANAAFIVAAVNALRRDLGEK